MKSKSDKGALNFLRGSKNGIAIALLLLFGSLLILLGSFGEKEKTQTNTDEEERLSEICSMIDGVGECRVMINYSDDRGEEVSAVLVLCSGASSVRVRSELTDAVCSLYGIGANRVEIFYLNPEYKNK